MFGTGTLQHPLAASYSDGSWLVLPETLAAFSFSVLRETSACAGSTGLGCEHGAVTATLGRRAAKSALGGLSITSGFETLHRDFTTGQEKLCLPWNPQSPGPAAIPGCRSRSTGSGFAAGQLGNIQGSHKQVKLDVWSLPHMASGRS